jgi:flagellin
MSFRINTSIATMTSNTVSSLHSRQTASSLEKLSSGLRINKAADDSSGLMISNNLQLESHTLSQSIQNANDGIGIANIMDKSVSEQIKLVEKFKIKATEYADDSNSTESKKAIFKEMKKIIKNIDDIAETTQFNGKNLLNGDFVDKQFQVGTGNNSIVNLSVGSTHSSKIGHTAYKVIQPPVMYDQTVNLEIRDYNGMQTMKMEEFRFDGTQTVQNEELRQSINKNLSGTNIRAIISQTSSTPDVPMMSANGVNSGDLVSDPNAVLAFMIPKGITNLDITLNDHGARDNMQIFTKDGTHIFGHNPLLSGYDTSDLLSRYSNNFNTGATYDNSGLLPHGNISLNGMSMDMTDQDTMIKTLTIDLINEDLLVFMEGSGAYDYTPTWVGNPTVETSDEELLKLVKYNSGANINATVQGNNNLNITEDMNNYHRCLADYEQIVLDDSIEDSELMDIADSAIMKLDSIQSELGSFVNQVTSTINNISASVSNLESSKSQILDTDYAQEMNNLEKNNILSQASSYVFSQSNKMQENIVQLLK